MNSHPTLLSLGDWIALHREHVQGLIQNYNEMFRRFATVDAVVIHSGKAQQRYSGDDQYWPAVPTPHFLHWTPYQETPALLIISAGERPKLVVERHTSFWEGALAENPMWDRDSFTITAVDKLTYADVRGSCVYIGDEKITLPRMLDAASVSDDVVQSLDQLRTIKSPYEVAAVQAATISALGGHHRLKEIFMSGAAVSELELHYEFLRATSQTDFTVPYGNIVALGAHAAILHHVHYDQTRREGDLSLLVDAGAQHNGYASDITRTWVRGNSLGAKKFAELVAGVEQVQQQLCQEFEVGRDYQDLHNQAHELLAQVLINIGVTSASVEDLVVSGATRCLFPHGLGHSLGLQVHDVGMKLVKPAGENPYLRNTSTIQSGQIVTVEPGIYFIGSLLTKLQGLEISRRFNWDLIATLKKFGGVRIEDNVLATEQGPKNLTRLTL